jgi:PAS domain S-box-containing protein
MSDSLKPDGAPINSLTYPVLLHEILKQLPVRVFWKDTELRYLGCNAMFARDAGFSSPEDVIGKDDFQMAWREQAELYRADDKRVMTLGQPKLDYDEPQTTADGSMIWLRTSKVPIRDDKGNVIGILGIYEDITARKQSEVEWHNASRALRAIGACNEAMFCSQNEADLLKAVCTLIVDIGEYRMSWIGYAQDDADKSVKPAALHGVEQGYLDDRRFSWDENSPVGRGPTGHAIRTGKPQINQNFLTNPNLAPWREAALQRGYQSSIALPLIDTTGVFGALMIYAVEPDAFSTREVELLEGLAKNLAFGVNALRTRAERDRITEENQRRMVAQQQSLKDFVRVIASTVEMRDPYTAGHQQRVSQLAAAIAREMGLSEHTAIGIELASLVHDVGQINVPAEIMCRPGKLREHEYPLIQKHPQTGYEALKDIQFPWPIATIVWQHHERLDGSGYPQGLKGDQILLESRITAVADVTEAMLSHRPYRPARTMDYVIAELESGSGTRYDKAAVDACLTLLREKRFSFNNLPVSGAAARSINNLGV